DHGCGGGEGSDDGAAAPRRHVPTTSNLSPARAESDNTTTTTTTSHVSGDVERQGVKVYPSATATAPCVRRRGRRRGVSAKSRLKATAAARHQETLEQQSQGLHFEMKRAMKVATTTFKEGDRVESRWRRPTRLDKAKIDPGTWHPGRVVQSHKDGGRVDVVFEDGGGERLSGISTKHVRLAPPPSSLERHLLMSSGRDDDDVAAAVVSGRRNSYDRRPSCTPTSAPTELVCSASRRELAHIACATKSLRCTWEDPVPISQEMARLRMLEERKMRSRPEWRGSFPLVDFSATKRLPFGAGGMAGTGARRARNTAASAVSAVVATRDHQLQAQGTAHDESMTRLRTLQSSPSSSLKMPTTVPQEQRKENSNRDQGQGDRCTFTDHNKVKETNARSADKRRSSSSSPSPVAVAAATAAAAAGAGAETAGATALLEAQAKLVSAAVAYDRCVAGARDCLYRGCAAFRLARTYSEQQKAFEESTATLGPAQPARAGYTDWRGSPVVGLQSATLDVVEAMDDWAAEWAAAKGGKADAGGGDNAFAGEGVELKDGAVAEVAVAAPPFLWEGSPLVSTIIGQSAKLVAGAPELKEWYGPGFPVERNPFFLAYPVDDRPVTPRSALVRAWVNGELATTVSPMLMEEREKEEAALKAVVDKQASAPSWWPTALGALGGDAHYQRIRRAEKVIVREEASAIRDREPPFT
ncbi:unnamed protein product, partial [Ectocarpus sp. 13 AM-2016]